MKPRIAHGTLKVPLVHNTERKGEGEGRKGYHSDFLMSPVKGTDLAFDR